MCVCIYIILYYICIGQKFTVTLIFTSLFWILFNVLFFHGILVGGNAGFFTSFQQHQFVAGKYKFFYSKNKISLVSQVFTYIYFDFFLFSLWGTFNKSVLKWSHGCIMIWSKSHWMNALGLHDNMERICEHYTL